MNAQTRKRASNLELIDEYAADALRYENAMRNKISPKEFKKVTDSAVNSADAIFNELRSRVDGLETFQVLLTHDSSTVKFWAASHVLDLAPPIAIKVLEALSKEAPFDVSIKAQMVLSQISYSKD